MDVVHQIVLDVVHQIEIVDVVHQIEIESVDVVHQIDRWIIAVIGVGLVHQIVVLLVEVAVELLNINNNSNVQVQDQVTVIVPTPVGNQHFPHVLVLGWHRLEVVPLDSPQLEIVKPADIVLAQLISLRSITKPNMMKKN